MARSKRGFSRSRGRTRNNRSWFGVTIDGSQGPATFTVRDLLLPSDYEQANLQASAKIEVIYWNMTFAPGALPGGDVNWAHWGLTIQDPQVALANASQDPSVAANLGNERWLLNRDIIVPEDTTQVYSMNGIVKQKVRLKEQSLRISTSNTDPAEAYDFYFSARILLSY